MYARGKYQFPYGRHMNRLDTFEINNGINELVEYTPELL
jgi:hypothetical protein